MPMTSCLADEIFQLLVAGETVSSETQEHLSVCPVCQERLKANRATSVNPPEPMPESIGRYRIVNLLGIGGQCVVYRAIHSDLYVDVVIKLARKPLKAGGVDKNLLHKEGQMLAGMHHENLVQVYDIDFYKDHPWLAMELVRGRTLEEIAQKKPYPPKQAASVVAALAKALAYLDPLGIVHQDIKPENIMIDEAGRPRLIDFGLARMHDIWSDGANDPVGGTLAYLAPEQASSEEDRIGSATDVFGLGGVLYFLLTGKAPNSGTTPHEVLKQARLCLVDLRALAAPGIPKQLAQICRKALDADPAKRPSAKEMAKDLDRFTSGILTSGISRRIALSAALAFLFAAFGGWTYRRELGLTRPPPNPLYAGEMWVGTFYWATDPKEATHDVQLEITDQQGNTFKGIYESEHAFKFRVEGSVNGNIVEWHFVGQLSSGELKSEMLERAKVKGTLTNESMGLRYTEDRDIAVMELRRINTP